MLFRLAKVFPTPHQEATIIFEVLQINEFPFVRWKNLRAQSVRQSNLPVNRRQISTISLYLNISPNTCMCEFEAYFDDKFVNNSLLTRPN